MINEIFLKKKKKKKRMLACKMICANSLIFHLYTNIYIYIYFNLLYHSFSSFNCLRHCEVRAVIYSKKQVNERFIQIRCQETKKIV